MVQKHLSYSDMTNLGCFYTPEKFINKTIELIKNNITNLQKYYFVDSSCGYGTFLNALSEYKTIGCDIDSKAIDIAKQIFAYFDLTLHIFTHILKVSNLFDTTTTFFKIIYTYLIRRVIQKWLNKRQCARRKQA